MCFSSKPKTPAPPADAPAPPIEGADVPQVGAARKEDNKSKFGTDTPSYRVTRDIKPGSITPNKQITM